MDVARNVGYGLRQRKVGKDEEARRVAEALALVRLVGYERRRTWEMSGGQQQRVALARALVNRPTVLLLDEPLGALDLKLRKEMQLELKALQREVGITFVYVTHDQEEALTMSDVIVVMRDGRIQQQGGPTELYERPVNRFVADFIGSSNFLPGTIAEFDSAKRIATVRTDGGLTIRGRVTDAAATPGRATPSPSPPARNAWRPCRPTGPRRTPTAGHRCRGASTKAPISAIRPSSGCRPTWRASSSSAARTQRGREPARAWDRAIRSWCAGSMRRTWSCWPRVREMPATAGGGGSKDVRGSGDHASTDDARPRSTGEDSCTRPA